MFKKEEKEKEEKEKEKKEIDFNNHFKMPIYYNDKKVSLKKHIVNVTPVPHPSS